MANLAWLIARDKQGRYNDLCPLKLMEKLMWGSEVPMILTDHGTYKKLFDALYVVLEFHTFDTGNYRLLAKNALPGRNELFDRLVNTDPSQFLFG